MKIFVTGTDTGVGKTVFAAALAGALNATFWKPVQAGDLTRTDSDIVRDLSGLPPEKMLPEGYRLSNACSPHRSAELDGLKIDVGRLCLPEVNPLVVEGAGGVMVPITRDTLFIDLLAGWRLPTVLVARTSLGTINHSLLSLESLRSRNIPLIGVAFIGEPNPDSEEMIGTLGRTKRLGRLPMIDPIGSAALRKAFAANFDLKDFQ